MQFLKKNYEKILLGLVLLGLVVAAAYLPFRIDDEKSALETLRKKRFEYPVDPLPPLETNRYEMALKRAGAPLSLDLASTNKLFNPVRWLKGPNGPVKMEVGSELEKLDVTNIKPLYLTINLDAVNMSDAGARYVIVVEQQAAPKPGQRGKKPYYVSVGDKKDVFALREIKGPPEAPTAAILELSDSGERVSITKEKPFRRVDGYMADLLYRAETRSFINRRVGDKLKIAGEEYNIVAITQKDRKSVV